MHCNPPPYPMKILKSLLITTLLGVSSALAAPLTFSTRSAFDSAAGTTSLITFNGLAGSGGAFFGSSITQGDVTFTNGAARYFVLPGNAYNAGLTSDYLNNNAGSQNLGIVFGSPVYSFGMDFGTVFTWGGGSSLQLTLSSGESFSLGLGAYLAGSGSGTLSFFGVVSDVAISSVSMVDTSQGMIIDNFAYGLTPNSVPDAGGTALLVALAGVGMVVARRRRA